VKVGLGPGLAELALHWSYRIRNRARWKDDAETVEVLEAFAQRDLEALGVGRSALQRFTNAGFVEVSVPWETSEEASATRRMPWEALLNLATRSSREDRALLVVRHLRRDGAPAGQTGPGDGQPLVVVSAPGRIGEEYEFDDERTLILGSLRRGEPRPLTSPTLEALEREVVSLEPGIVHLTGVDTHQGASILDVADESVVEDGFYLATRRGRPAPVAARDLADALNKATSKPMLVTTNLYNSAAQTCAWIVALGAGAAIGFQDEVDDVVAERFFGDFYTAWRLSIFELRRAFQLALSQAMEDSPAMRGSGIALWSAESLCLAEESRPQTGEVVLEDAVGQRVRNERESQIRIGANQRLDAIVKVFPSARKELNYALLHNNVDLFESFFFRKFQSGRLDDVSVEVGLQVGGEVYKYEQTLDLTKPVTDLNPSIRVPLTWDYLRSMRETTRTALYVTARCGKRTLCQETYSVQLHPLEQWRDDPQENRYLASFIQPGDPAVAQIVERARPHLRALLDDADASFDGYQSIDLGDEDPYAWVDLQVQALWAAIAFELGLAYTNPLATPGESYQRLRSPSEILRTRFGTCIDLALLFASCLEFVEIYPVVFLIKGHSFPGYWRGDGLHARFLQVEDGTDADLERLPGPIRVPSAPWMVEGPGYREIVRVAKSDQLVPLETTLLASRGSFRAATEQGSENLASEQEFDSMMDVKRARTLGVNALPLWRIAT